MDVTLSGKDASAFSLSSNELTDVAPGLSERFSVFPITGLSCSTYNATVTVSNDNGVSAAFDVNFHVEKTLQLPLEISGLKASYTYGDTPVALQTTGGSGTGSVSYTSSNTTVASIVNESISFHKAGTFTITASKAEDNNYLATSVTSELVSVVSAAPNVALSAYGGKSDDVSGGTSVGESDNTSGRISVVKSDDASGRISVVKSDDASGDISGSTTTLDNITLHCIVAPAGNGNVPQGNVRFFCDGEAISNAIPLNSLGEANMQVGALSVGEHQFSVEYLGQPDYYLSGSATLLHTVVLSQQQPLEINGIPEQINYGDAKFTIAANGGSGSGDLKFSAINDNGVVKIGAVTGARASITIVGAGQTTITVTKAADDIYAQASKQIDISVAPRDIANVSLSVSNNPIYTGKQLCPVVDVSDDATIIASDYDINYGTNIMAGEKSGSVTLTGKRNYTGSKTVTFSILKRSLSGASITLSNTAFAYTGTAIKPTVLAIEVDGINVNSSEYELNYANNINTGFATVTAVAKTDGNFSGSAIAVFAIGSQFDASIGGINGGTGSEAGIDLSFYKHGGSNNLGLPKTGDFLLLPGLMMSLSLAAVAMPLVAFSQLTRKPKFRRKR
ncbi:MAG: Ig-like domain-containing protein [Coriobacteriales bacterium]|nr:Ig-like domain-containing protein [Coriobacteriales bacterium]